MPHHHLHRHTLIRIVPAIVIRTHADHLIRYLGFLGQLRLGQYTHVDHSPAPLPIHIALRAGAELRALHTNDRPLIMQNDTLPLQRMATLPYQRRDAFIKRVSKRDVANDSIFKEREWPDPLGAVDDGIRDHKVAGFDFLTETAHSAEGDDGAHADGAEGGDVGAGGYLMRGVLVVDSMPGEEGDWDWFACAGGGMFQDDDWGGGFAPWGCDVE